MSLRRLIASINKFHPLIFAIYSPISLLAANLGEVLPSNVLRPLFASLIFALTVWGISWILVRDWNKAALIASVAMVLFFSYGHIYSFIKTWTIGDIMIGRHRLLAPLWGILLLIWTLWVIRYKGRMDSVENTFWVVVIVLIITPTIKIGNYYLPEIIHKPKNEVTSGVILQPITKQTSPDVYYIILDGYGRSDVLKDLYDYDNSNFISILRGEGFFVADSSHSNYNQTALSLASSLNMEYVNDLADQMGKGSTDRRPLAEMIAHSQVSKIFQELGYQFVTFDTGSMVTQIKDASIYLTPTYQDVSQEKALLRGFYLNDFEGIYLKTTIVRIWFDEYLAKHNSISDFAIEYPYMKQRSRILFIFDQLSKIPEWSGNYFVFAHILAPHPPFVFDSQGGLIQHSDPISFQDTGCCRHEEYIDGYHDQATYITKQIQQTIHQILSQSAIPPIIIIQGDHGPGAFYDGNSMDELKTFDRMSILNAYYFPKSTDQSLYATITPVNSFRVLFNTQFSLDFPLLPDKSYFSPGSLPYDLAELPPEWLMK